MGLISHGQRLMQMTSQLQDGWHSPRILLHPTAAAKHPRKCFPMQSAEMRFQGIIAIIIYWKPPVEGSGELFSNSSRHLCIIHPYVSKCGISIEMIYYDRSFQSGGRRSCGRDEINNFISKGGIAEKHLGTFGCELRVLFWMSETSFRISVLFRWHRPCPTASGDQWVYQSER